MLRVINLVVLAMVLFIASYIPMVRAVEPTPDKDGWFDLFDGKSLDEWKASEDFKAFIL